MSETPIVEEKSQSTQEISRRQFLKGAAVLAGVGALAASGVVARERLSFMNDRTIDMSNFISKANIGEKGERLETVNFEAMRIFYPDLVKTNETGNLFLENTNETPVILDFSKSEGKEIWFVPKITKVSKSNIPWEKCTQESGYGKASVGMELVGAFSILGNKENPPTFMGDVVERIINITGSGKGKCRIENINFKNLRSFKQDENGGGDCPDPAFIAIDNIDVEIQGITIEHTPSKPDNIDETNAQLAKGIIFHNTNNKTINNISIKDSSIRGLQWDGITGNGLVGINIENSDIIQDYSFKLQRGVGVASTFNSPDGNIKIAGSRIEYCKGTAIWINQNLEKETTNTNIEIIDSVINGSGWAVSAPGDHQKTEIKNLTIESDHGGYFQTDGNHLYPLDFSWKGESLDLSFDNVTFEFKKAEIGDIDNIAYLSSFVNWDDFDKFKNIKANDFFPDNFGLWGDISVKIKYSDKETASVLTRKDFLNFVGLVSRELPEANLSSLRLYYDLESNLFLASFGLKYDSTEKTIEFSDLYYIEPLNKGLDLPKKVPKNRIGDQVSFLSKKSL